MCKEHSLQPSVNRNSSCGPDKPRCGTAGEAGAGGETYETEGGKGASMAGVLFHHDGMDG